MVLRAYGEALHVLPTPGIIDADDIDWDVSKHMRVAVRVETENLDVEGT